jgi:Gluconate 2-dehydrogenase subunit 3
MKRRSFVQSLLITPAAAPLASTAAQEPKPLQQPPPQPNTPARELPHQPRAVPKLDLLEVDIAAETQPHYFTAEQFATLEKLGSVMVPPLKGNPGALDAQAPEFLDFLISVSPADRQTLYRNGLESLNLQAQSKFNKPFSELDFDEVGSILRPLLTARPWPHDLPDDPLKNFVAQIHEDLRTATMNSREWAVAVAKSGHRFTRGFHGTGLYWAPIDPISEA